MKAGRALWLMLPLVAGCGASVPELSPGVVARQTMFERAVDNMLAFYGGDANSPIDEQTAPCIVSGSTPEEMAYLATPGAPVQQLLRAMLSRPVAQYCLSGGAL